MSPTEFSRNVFPTSLLCEERNCLVVGGGKIAAHKTDLLLDADAAVTVVSPKINEPLQAALHAERIHYIPREFEPKDVHKMFLVFAATNDRWVNRQILEACRAHNILCCSVDGNWRDGDFATPAILREEDFILSISTGGSSCRRSRRLKENLRHHVKFLQNADLLVIGIDHNNASVEELEQAKKRAKETPELLSCLWGVHEFIILSTCNRLELIGIVSEHHQTLKLLLRLLDLSENAYIKKGRDAFMHLAEVAAGLHAQTLAETNIVAQLKEAFTQATLKEWANGGMQSWLDVALHISKDIRREIEPHIESMEIEDACALWVTEHVPQKENVLLLGRGVIGQGILKHFPRARQISGRDPSEIETELPQADLIIGTTGSDHYVLTKEHRPLLKNGATLIDLSMPRNLDPSLPGLIGLTELKAWCRPENLAHILKISRPIIEEHIHEYERLVNT